MLDKGKIISVQSLKYIVLLTNFEPLLNDFRFKFKINSDLGIPMLFHGIIKYVNKVDKDRYIVVVDDVHSIRNRFEEIEFLFSNRFKNLVEVTNCVEKDLNLYEIIYTDNFMLFDEKLKKQRFDYKIAENPFEAAVKYWTENLKNIVDVEAVREILKKSVETGIDINKDYDSLYFCSSGDAWEIIVKKRSFYGL